MRNFYQSIGGRTKFDYHAKFSILPTKFIFGAEFNQANSKGTQYVNNQGKEGALTSNVDYKDLVYALFLQTESDLWANATLTLGMSYNSTAYDFTNYLSSDKSGIKDFKPQVTPRISLSHHFGTFLSFHGSISTGFYAPTHSEIQNADGTVNEQLQAQEALNYEVNAKGSFFNSRLAYDLALFKMNMKGELIGQTISPGMTIYHNSGKTNHSGVELALSYAAILPSDQSFISELTSSVAVTYSDFKFKDYKVFGADNAVIADYSGNELTGIAPWAINSSIRMETTPGIYANINYYFNDRFPLNDLNSYYNKAYHVINTKLGYRQMLSKQLELHGYLGVDNIANSKYSSLVALNATGFNGAEPAFFNPSPTASFYTGLGVKFLL